MSFRNSTLTLSLSGLLACFAGACGDDDSSVPLDASTSSPDADSGDPVGQRQAPLIVVSEREGPEGRNQYLHALRDFPADRKLSASDAVELAADVVVHAGDGAVWVYEPGGSIMRKYLVDDQLRITRGPQVGFSELGITGFDADVVWVSPERAFMVDEASGKIVLWNPKTMELGATTAIDPALLRKDGLNVQLQQNAVIAGGRAFFTASWRDWDTYRYVPGAALAWFDTALDQPTLHIVHEDRCASSVAAPFVDDAGDVYVMGDGGLGFDLLANPTKSTRPQCVRRIRAGQTDFDPDFFVNVQEATGSPGFRDGHPMRSNKLLLNLWAPSVPVASVAGPSPAWYWELQPYYEYVILDLGSKQATPVSALPRAAAQFSLTLRVDGLNYVQSYRADNGANVSRVAPDGRVEPVLELDSGTDVQYLGRL